MEASLNLPQEGEVSLQLHPFQMKAKPGCLWADVSNITSQEVERPLDNDSLLHTQDACAEASGYLYMFSADTFSPALLSNQFHEYLNQ